MKSFVYWGAAAALFFVVSTGKGANVEPGGYTNGFGIRPVAADWATLNRTGGATDVYDLDADVNANITAGGVTAQVGSSTGNPPGASGTAFWSSTGLYLQTRPTGNRYVALMGKFANNSGTNATEVTVAYALTIANGGVAEESGKGTRFYYSLTGLGDSWINVPALNSTSTANGRVNMSASIEVNLARGASLYLLWADDNSGSSGTDPAYQMDDFSLRVTAGTPFPLAAALSTPASNAVFASSSTISAVAALAFGTAPYSVEFFTNSGAGNTIFASAGTVGAASFELALGPLAVGIYNIYAVASDSSVPAANAYTATNTFLVVDPLAVALERPVDGATFDNVTPVTGTATILGGTAPYSVQFFLDGVASGAPVTSPPYERDFGVLFVGDHTIRARATDARGWVSNSLAHTVHIAGPLGVTFTPTNGASFIFGQQIVLNATVGGGTGPYTATFYTNGQPAGSLSSAPYVLDLGMLPAGGYSTFVQVVDSAAPLPQAVHSTTNFFFVGFNTLFVLLTEPDEGDVVLEGAPFTLTASAFVSAPVTISNVQFFYEGTLVGTDTNTPYSFVLTGHQDGTRLVYATVTDSLGRTSYSTTNRMLVIDGGPPPNDDFNNAIALSGPAANVVANNLTATKQPGEPNHAAGNSGGGSLWWTWTPSTSGPATIDTIGSDFDTLLGVYTGNVVNQLTVIAQNDDASGVQSRVQFNANAGTVYRIAVDGFSNSRGLIRLNIRGAGGLELESPTNGMIVTMGDPIPVTARILPDFPNPPPSRVDFYRGGSLFASVTNAPFTFVITNAPAGSNSFYAIGYDSLGNLLQSATATVFVQKIGVMILSPLANTSFGTTNPITINTWVYLPSGSITNVEFFVNGISIGQDDTFPFSGIWSNVVGGSHRIIAVGRSDAGVSYQSDPVNIGVVRTLVPFGAVWRYLDDGSNQGTNWTRRDFDDSSWGAGPAPLGYGDSGGRLPATTNAAGHATTYYRHSFVVTNVAGLNFLAISMERDDGFILYLNGFEIWRLSMPSGPIFYTNFASSTASDDGQALFGFTSATAVSRLVEGTNVLAVEMHQDAPAGTDLWFHMRLNGTPRIIVNVSPLVSITSPTNNQYFVGPSNITVQANASDPDGTVALVEFFSDGVKIGESTNAPYRIVWDAPPIGAHVLTARVTDALGLATISAGVPIVVYDAVGTPLAAITSPAHGAVMEGPTNLLVMATANAIHGVTNVKFLADGVEFGRDDGAPYSALWPAPFGTNVLTAIVSDANGAMGTSPPVTVVIIIPPTNVIAPTLVTQFPLGGSTITNLTSITVTFSEYVQNVDAADLLINGIPATSVNANHSRSNYSFSFPHPAYGQVNIAWAAGHGITDYGWPAVLPFDETQPGATWTYTLVDQTPPTIAARVPAAGSVVTNLPQVSVTFSEAVTGVDASDLRINGAPALEVTGGGASYTFRVSQPPFGTVNISWSTTNDIFDLAATPNAFDRAAPGAAWSFFLDNRTILLQSNSVWRFVKGTNEASTPRDAWRRLAFDDSGWSNGPAPFFYGDPYDSLQNPGTVLADMATDYTSVYLRTEFNVLNRGLITNVWLNVQSDDGFIAWINGVEVRRYNAPTGEVAYSGIATGVGPEPQNRGAAYITYSLTNAAAALVDGRNVLAVHGLNQQPSSDFGFNAQLYTFVIDLATVAPRLLVPEPPAGDVLYLTNVTIRFSEPVTGVDATDLLINGVPASALSTTTNTTFTFSFAQPPYGPVLITWHSNHAIADFDDPPKAFNGNAASSILSYTLINPSNPRVLTQFPLPGSTVTGLTFVVVIFTEPVMGVDAADLLVSGAPAESVSDDGPEVYQFVFTQPPSGTVTIGWATNHGIVDVAGNGFDRIRFGAQWTYTLINPAPSAVITSPANHSYRLEPANVTLAATATDLDGIVMRVQFYEGGSLLGEATNAPYSLALSNLSLGVYTFRAVATDNIGLRGTSAPVVLNVVTSLPAALVRGPYLQMGTPSGGVVRWRTDVATDGLVFYGTDPDNLTNFAAQTAVTNEHIVQLNGLDPDTKYFYSIGSAAQRLAGGEGVNSDFWFRTSPVAGLPRRTRLWVLGDPGTAGNGAPDRQQSTRDAFYEWAADNGAPDLWLMLGDNAYDRGTDEEYQRAVFDMYPTTLRNKFLWPTLGNHETSQSTTATDFPYLHIFSLPQDGDAGGVPSGTEKYYSFDYANIHFVCLDSMTSGRTGTSPMAEWLRNDLAATTAEWIIVFFHHPPYTKGNHDSDREADLIAIRENIIPILEANGVDLVLNGHSHAWERSYLLDGHHGFSDTLTESMKLDPGDGREEGGGPYRKDVDGRGVVYTVAGSSGQATGGSLNHPAHFLSLNELGSMVIDINESRLDALFLHQNGEIQDHFTLIKPDLRPTAPIHLLALPAAATEIRLDWADVATNELGYAIERSLDGVNFAEVLQVATDATTALDTGLVMNATYYYRVRATNSVGVSDYSNIASATTGLATAPPQAPANLVAVSDDGVLFYRSRMILVWQDRSSDEGAFQIERSRDALLFVPVATVAANTTVYLDHGLDSASLYFYRVRAVNALGISAASNPSGDETHPQSQIVRAGQSVSFHAGVEGAPAVRYQWRFSGNPIPNETNETFTLLSADLEDQGEYSVVVGAGNVVFISNPATLVVVSPPRILSQPQDLVLGVGMTANFTVNVEGTAPFRYHWRKNGAPLGISTPNLALPAVQFGDQGDYDVIIENDHGSLISRAAALRVFAMPALAQIPDLIAEVLKPLRFANQVVDPNIPPLDLRFALAPGAPTNAYINPLTGFFRWTPNRAQAPGTNTITVSVFDQTRSVLSDSTSFNVRVNHYVELSVGSLVMLNGTYGFVPIDLFSSLEITGLECTLRFAGERFNEILLEELAPETARVAWQRLDTDTARLVVTAVSGPLRGLHHLARLRLLAAPLADSVVVPLRAELLSAAVAETHAVPTLLGGRGEIVVVGARPWLEAHFTPTGQRELTLYGMPGTYSLQWATNLINPTWRLRGTITITNLTRSVLTGNTPPTNMPGFFRVRQ